MDITDFDQMEMEAADRWLDSLKLRLCLDCGNSWRGDEQCPKCDSWDNETG